MKALLQRVSRSSVVVDSNVVGEIEQGLLVLLGVQQADTHALADKLLDKIFNYRLFSDEQQKMNLSVKDINGGVLLVSQFTLAAETKKGLRPGFSTAADPEHAKSLYDYCVEQAKLKGAEYNNKIATGIFGADMQVSLTNDGPATFLLEVN